MKVSTFPFLLYFIHFYFIIQIISQCLSFGFFGKLQYYFPDDVKGLIGCSYGPFKSLPDVVLIGFALKFQSLVLFDQVCFDFALIWKLYVGTFKQLKAVIHIQVLL